MVISTIATRIESGGRVCGVNSTTGIQTLFSLRTSTKGVSFYLFYEKQNRARVAREYLTGTSCNYNKEEFSSPHTDTYEGFCHFNGAVGSSSCARTHAGLTNVHAAGAQHERRKKKRVAGFCPSWPRCV